MIGRARLVRDRGSIFIQWLVPANIVGGAGRVDTDDQIWIFIIGSKEMTSIRPFQTRDVAAETVFLRTRTRCRRSGYRVLKPIRLAERPGVPSPGSSERNVDKGFVLQITAADQEAGLQPNGAAVIAFPSPPCSSSISGETRPIPSSARSQPTQNGTAPCAMMSLLSSKRYTLPLGASKLWALPPKISKGSLSWPSWSSAT